jgi:hypothetical protein
MQPTTQQILYRASEIAEKTNYTLGRLSQLRLKGIAGVKGQDWYYEGKTTMYTHSSLLKILEYKKTAANNVTGRPRKKIQDS